MIKCLRFLVATVTAILNLVLLSSVAFVLYFCKVISIKLGFETPGVNLNRAILALIRLHSANLRRILQTICGIELQAFLSSPLHVKQSYIMVINHRSHVDILILLAFFYDRIPDLKFFLKRSLLYVPFLGWFCYLMNYIFVHRISAARLRRDPNSIIRQRQRIKQQCCALVTNPVTLAVFVEGTRFSRQKHQQSSVTFRNLLSPQPAGLALALESCAGSIHELIDVTLVYDLDTISVWKLFSGSINTVEIHSCAYNMTKLNLVGDYVQDRQFRKRFTTWVKALWLRKDALLTHARTRLQIKIGSAVT